MLLWCLTVVALLAASSSPAGAVAGFGDVADGEYYTEAVQWSADKDIAGIDGNCFAPDAVVTRGEASVYIWNMQDRPAAPAHGFADVTDEGQDAAVSWMSHKKITTGTSETTFSPDTELTRAHLVTFLWRLAGQPPAPDHSFDDVQAPWQQGSVSWAADRAITTGTSDTTFSPDTELTRAHLVTFLWRYQDQPDATIDSSSPPCGDETVPTNDQADTPDSEAETDPTDDQTNTSDSEAETVPTNDQADTPDSEAETDPTDDQTNTASVRFKTISAGGSHSCGVNTDNTVICWGNNEDGQADAPRGEFKTVTTGRWHSCGVKTDNTVTCWGYNRSARADAPAGEFKTVSAGRWLSCGVHPDNTVTCWGNNRYGQADAPDGEFKTVTAGRWHSCGVKTDNTVTCWGNNRYGQADAPRGEFKTVTTGRWHSCGVTTDNTVTCWGNNRSGQADAPDGEFKTVNAGDFHSCGVKTDNTITCWGLAGHGRADAPDGEFKTVTAGNEHSCGVQTDNTVTCWGNNGSGQADAPDGEFKTVNAGDFHSCGVKTDNTVTCWGHIRDGQADAPDGEFKTVTAGDFHSCGVKFDNTVTCWGSNLDSFGNYSGQANAPDGEFKTVTAGSRHSCGVKTDNTVTCWGRNWFGQANAPDGEFKTVTAGSRHSCGVKTDNTVTCWGHNDFGQADAPGGEFKTVTAGSWHSCGVKTDNTVTCWGWNGSGQAGAPGGEFKTVSAGSAHSCGVKTDNTFTCWGHNVSWRAGAPRVAIKTVSVGDEHSCGVNTDNTVTCWGHKVVIDRSSPMRDPDASLLVSLTTTTPGAPTGAFDVAIAFAEAVTGFAEEDIRVTNGATTGLSGSGSRYTATVTAAAEGPVVVRIPGGVARDVAGNWNQPSGLLVRHPGLTDPSGGPGFDIWDRKTVIGSYREEFERQEPDHGFTGNVGDCEAGTTSQAFRDSVVQRLNWYRTMAGLATATEDPGLSATAQRKALIMLAQGALSHTPSPDWACYTDIEHPGENLGLSAAGVRGVDGYMQDRGDTNQAVGHRRQILSPLVVRIGTGNVRDDDRLHRVANAMHLAYDFGLVPAVREPRGFVAWPPAGYVPRKTVWGRWSFQLDEANFDTATVAVTDDYGPVPVKVIHRESSTWGSGAIVWAVHGDSNSDELPRYTDRDHCYTVTVDGVTVAGATQLPFQYVTCLIDVGTEVGR